MRMETVTTCPLSGLDAEEIKQISEFHYRIPSLDNLYPGIDCFSYFIDDQFGTLSTLTSSQKGKLFQWIFQELQNKTLREQKTVFVPSNYWDIECLAVDSPLNQKITPTQKLDWLLEYLYHNVESLGTMKYIPNFELFPILATVDPNEVDVLIQILVEKNYCFEKSRSLDSNELGYGFPIETTLEGFEAYEAYKEGKAHSNFGFMALKFSTDDYISPADEIYKNYWKKAVQEAGYPLNALYEKSEAGNINNSMEAQIRKCKFLIADVTPPEDTDTPNPNVMWEAGFTEGLNKPVFYVCDKNKKPKKRVFDIDHHNTLYYDTSKMKEDCEELKATIFNTFAKDAQ